MRYDFLIVGAGIYGATFAQQCKEKGKTCLVLEKRNHIAGNCYTENVEGIDRHVFGPHIFNTNNKKIWDYFCRFTQFIQYAHRVKAVYDGRIYTMPICLQTLYEFYGVRTPAEGEEVLRKVRVPIESPKNLEEWCLSQVGPDLYNTLISGYTAKQWGRHPRDLPASIIKRLPVRLNFDDRWHQAAYSGIPSEGYTKLIANMLDGVRVELGVDFFKKDYSSYADRVVYTGPIDQLFDNCYGRLEYRTLKFDTKTLSCENYQGISQVNYTDGAVPFTRVVEHKHFTGKQSDKTIVTWEYPEKWQADSEPYYPVNDEVNGDLYLKYKKLLPEKMLVGGRLAEYRYMDMDAVAASALKKFNLATEMTADDGVV